MHLKVGSFAVKVSDGIPRLALPRLAMIDGRVLDELFPARPAHGYRKPLAAARRLEPGAVFFVARVEAHRVEDHKNVGHHHAVQIVQPGKETRLADDASCHVTSP